VVLIVEKCTNGTEEERFTGLNRIDEIVENLFYSLL